MTRCGRRYGQCYGIGHEKLPAVTDAVSATPSSSSRHAQDRLHQPFRLVVAAAELVLAVVSGWAVTWCWGNAVGTMTIRANDGAELVSRVYEGDWIGLAFACAAVAALLTVDAARQAVLGVRTRRWRRRRSSRPA